MRDNSWKEDDESESREREDHSTPTSSPSRNHYYYGDYEYENIRANRIANKNWWGKRTRAVLLMVLVYIAWDWGTNSHGFRVHGRGFLRRDNSRMHFRWRNLTWKLSTLSFWDCAGISSLILWLLGAPLDAILGGIGFFFFMWMWHMEDYGRISVRNRRRRIQVWL